MAKNIHNPAYRRLQTERSKIPTEGVEIGFFACPVAEHDILHWHVFIRGSYDSVYEGIVLHAELIFPYDYPMNPPKMNFKHEMFHPNIYKDNAVCISILHKAGEDPTAYEKADERWSPVQSIRTIVLSVMSILNEPNEESPANVDASKDYIKNKNLYYEQARSLALRHGLRYEDVLKICEDLSEEECQVMRKCLFE